MTDHLVGTAGFTVEGSSQTNPVLVVSLALFREESRKEVLLGVRRNTPSAPRHPGVLSTPTMRVPSKVFAALVDETVCQWRTGVHLVEQGPPFALGRCDFSQHPGAFILEGLLARKLGLGGALVDQRFHAEARLSAVALDLVEDPLGTELAEWTAMVTYSATIRSGSEAVPLTTESFSRLIWARGDLVARAMAAGDALIVDETLDPFEVCIGGLCIRSAIPLLEQ
jgi:hypothetical protein